MEPNEAYRDLAEWVDVSGHPDKAQFDALLSILVEELAKDAQRSATAATTPPGYLSHSGEFHRYFLVDKKYEQFFTTD